MKLAILIVGEYRTFAECRGTMAFLDQSNIDRDIYFSTWDETNTINAKPNNFHIVNLTNKPIHTVVTKEQIERDIGIPVKEIAIHSKTTVSHFPFMVHGWLHGFNLIKNSSISYTHVLVLRPDLFFGFYLPSENSLALLPEKFNEYTNSFGIYRNPSSIALDRVDFLEDTMFFSTYDNIEKILSHRLTDHLSKDWKPGTTIPSTEWHLSWYNYIVNESQLSLTTLPINGDCVIARFPTKISDDFETVWNRYWHPERF